MSEFALVKIADIEIPPRIRKDTGDISSLASSIEKRGLLHPITLTKDSDGKLHLAAGGRRLEAHRYLGREMVEAKIVDTSGIEDGIDIEMDENSKRMGLRLSERLESCDMLIARYQTRAALISKDLQQPVEGDDDDTPKASPEKRALENWAAKEAGLRNRTNLFKAKRIVRNGSSELVRRVDDETISVSAAACIAMFPREQQPEKLSDYIASAPTPDSNAGRPKGSPNKKKVRSHVGQHKGPTFEVGLAWLSWKLDDPTLPGRWPSITQLKQLPIQEIMDMQSSVVFMRVGALNIPDAVSVLNAWGFTYAGAYWLVDKELQHLPLEKQGLCGFSTRVPSALLVGSVGDAGSGWMPGKRPEPYITGKFPNAVHEFIEERFPKHPKADLFAGGELRKGWHKWMGVA